MKSGAQIGVAVAAGYVLGRFHKMKWAMALATMAGRKRLASQGGGMLKQGTKLVQSSPELTKLTDDIKGSLAEAGKAAAIAAVGSRISSFSEGLRERSESLRAASVAGSGGQPAAGAEDQDEERDEERDEAQDDRDSADGERSRPRDSGRARPDGDRRRSRSSESSSSAGRGSESNRSESRRAGSRSSAGRGSQARGSERPSRRQAADESVPRPRKRPAEESTRQPSRRRRETAHD